MQNKKSQITIFMLIGLVTIVIVGFLYFSKGTVDQAQITGSEEKLVTNKMASSQIEFLVQGCLDKAFSDALELITKQGAYIHQEQEGSMLTFPMPIINYTFDNKSYLVTYRITKNKKDTLPNYPCRDSSNAPKFCYYMNDKTQFSRLQQINYGSSSQLAIDSATSFLTLQKQLERYVENNTMSCINFSRFIGYNVTIGNSSSVVSVTDESVSVSLIMPLTITIQGVAPSISKFKFSSFQPVRLRKVHDAVQELLDYDNRDIDFDLKENAASGKFQSQFGEKIFKISALNLEIQKIENAENYDDIFIFTDHSSRLSGKPQHYLIARENRMPALDVIDIKAQSEDYDILLSPGQKLEFKPKAHDPDEDKITYSYKAYGDSAHIAEALRESMDDYDDDCKNRCSSYIVQPEDEGSGEDGIHIITVTASDSQYTDFQNVRVKVVSSLLAIPELRNLYGQQLFAFEEPYILDASSSILPDPSGMYEYIWLDSFKDETKTSLPENEQMTDEQLNTVDLDEECIAKWGSLLVKCSQDTVFDIKKSVPTASTNQQPGGELPQFNFSAVENRHNISLLLRYVTGERSIESIETKNVNVLQCIPQTTPDAGDLKYSKGYPYMYAKPLATDEVHELTGASQDDWHASNVCCNNDGTLKQDTYVCFEYPTTITDTGNFIKPNLLNNYNNYDIVQLLKTQLVVDHGTQMTNLIPSYGPQSAQSGLDIVTQLRPTNENIACSAGDVDNPSYCKVSFKQYCGKRGNACSGKIEYVITDPNDS